jgi:hypothetical protein
MYLYILHCGLEFTCIAEANTQQTFVDILDNDVIKPLRTFKVSQENHRSGGNPYANNWENRKGSTEETRMRIEDDLKESAAHYSDHVENKISKLQEAYLRKYHPQQCCPEDVRNKGFGGKVSALFRPRRDSEPEEGIVNATHEFQLGVLNQRFWISVRR